MGFKLESAVDADRRRLALQNTALQRQAAEMAERHRIADAILAGADFTVPGIEHVTCWTDRHGLPQSRSYIA